MQEILPRCCSKILSILVQTEVKLSSQYETNVSVVCRNVQSPTFYCDRLQKAFYTLFSTTTVDFSYCDTKAVIISEYVIMFFKSRQLSPNAPFQQHPTFWCVWRHWHEGAFHSMRAKRDDSPSSQFKLNISCAMPLQTEWNVSNEWHNKNVGLVFTCFNICVLWKHFI